MSVSEYLSPTLLMPGVALSQTDHWVRVSFTRPHRALSSAVLNGGFCHASHFLNVRVPKHSSIPLEDPALTLQGVSDQLACAGETVGMMTAASLRSLRVLSETIEAETVSVMVTTGLENARRAGDPAEYRSLEEVPAHRGTINMCVITSAQVADEAMVEMIAVATEAKVAVLQELQIKSAVTGGLATGTGTDAIAVFGGHGDHRARFAGKHTLLGERLAIMVMQVIRSSVAYKQVSST